MDANVLTSINTHLPYEYYSLPYPRPAGYPKSVMKEESENLGEILMGDRIRKSPYKEVCTVVAGRLLMVGMIGGKRFSFSLSERLLQQRFKLVCPSTASRLVMPSEWIPKRGSSLKKESRMTMLFTCMFRCKLVCVLTLHTLKPPVL